MMIKAVEELFDRGLTFDLPCGCKRVKTKAGEEGRRFVWGVRRF